MSDRSRLARLLPARLLRLLFCSLAFVVPRAQAHEVPRHVGVRAFVASPTVTPSPAAPGRLRVLVQIPMDAVRDVAWPVRASGTLDVTRATPFLRDAAHLWIADGVRFRNGATQLPAPTLVAVRAAVPNDRAFEQYATALSAVMQQPLDSAVDIVPGQLRLEALLDVAVSEPITDLVIEPRWAHLGVETSTVLRVITPTGAERAYSYVGDPGALRLDPRWWHAALRFVQEGAVHMFGGIDHLLFLLCLVLPFRALRPLIGIVTAFTIAHSITLVASALGYAPRALWFAPLVEVLIAASIVLMAIGNILGPKLERRWMIAFAFGLVHGFGFSAALGDQLQFAGAHLLTSLAAFNVGLELAQVGVLLVAVPLLNRVFAGAVPERTGIIVASALVTHEAWHWMTERFAVLRTYHIAMPAFDAQFAIAALRVGMAACVVTGIAWLMSGLMQRLQRRPEAVKALLLLLLASVAMLAAPSRVWAQGKSTATGVYTPDQAVKGREVFNSNCLGCHTVASHTGPAFQIRWFGRPLAELFGYLSNLMPKSAPGTLTEDEYVWVTAYILRLNGMPPGKEELSAEPSVLKSIRVDSLKVGRGVPTP